MSNYDKTKKLIINRPLNWTALNLSKEAKSLVFETDEEGNIKALPIINIDPQAASPNAFGSTNPMPIIIESSSLVPNGATAFNADPNIALAALSTASMIYYYNPALALAQRARTPTIWKSALISANGSTAIWTSAVGKKARLMGFRATLVNGTTAAAACLLRILDVAADTGIGVQVCGAALGAVGTSAIIANESYMNGYLMAATNTAINIDLSSALAVAGVFVQVWGTEE